MDYLLAKIKKKSDMQLVLSNETLFKDKYNFEKSKSYNDEYKLEDDEWFVVEDFANQDYCISLLKEDFVPVALRYVAREDYNKIDYIVSVQDENYYLFQKITPSYVYEKHRMISWANIINPSEQPQLINGENLLVIKNTPDCIYDKRANKLYFKNLSYITTIFEGINVLYREATDDEVEKFLSMDVVNVSSGFNKDYVKTANRRRIKEATERYNNFTQQQKDKIPSYISKYCPSIYDANTNKFNVSNESELTIFLNTLNQRYYTTEIDGEKRLANSVSPV